MAIYSRFLLLRKHHFDIQHLVFWLIGYVLIFFSPLYGQEINVNSYRTALAVEGIGDWEDFSIWEVWNGSSWNSATNPPNRDNDVFIEKNYEVRLTKNEEVGNLYLFADTDPGKKLNLEVYNLDVYGSLRCFNKSFDNYSLFNSTSMTEDWIYPETGNLVFKGASRTVIDRASWSGNNGQSRFGVIFNPDPEQTLTVNAVFKASSFVIQSGTVYQTVNRNGTPATSSFSFNIQDKISTAAYGDFTIEPGATLISEGTKVPGEIIMRTENRPAANFHLKEGGKLILLGQEPTMEALNILLEGDVYYSGSSGTQHFISGSMEGVTPPSSYNNLFFEGGALKILPDSLQLQGNFTQLGGGIIDGNNTSLNFVGNRDQEVLHTSLHLREANVHKSSGILSFDGNLTVASLFEMTSGTVDFRENSLHLIGDYSYTAGAWSNLAQLTYENIPSLLSPSNSTFPFVDRYLGGERTIILSGSLSSPSTDLILSYTQLPDINWDAGFEDYDNTPILYTLNSYFTFTLADMEPTDNLEIMISADNLTVENDGVLRIVGDDAAAPRFHLEGWNNMARREMPLADLHQQILTIGGTGIAAILPVDWLSHQAQQLPKGILVSWSTAQERDNREFTVLKSIDATEFHELGTVSGQGYSNQVQHYHFLDSSTATAPKVYYQIKQVDFEGAYDFSPVFHLDLSAWKHLSIFPNPYLHQKDPMTIRIPDQWLGSPAQISVTHISGMPVAKEVGTLEDIAEKMAETLESLSPGIYLILIESPLKQQAVRWLKKN